MTSLLDRLEQGIEREEEVGRENWKKVHAPSWHFWTPSPSSSFLSSFSRTLFHSSYIQIEWIRYTNRTFLKCQNTSLNVWSKINTSLKSSAFLSKRLSVMRHCYAKLQYCSVNVAPCSDPLHESSLFSSLSLLQPNPTFAFSASLLINSKNHSIRLPLVIQNRSKRSKWLVTKK